MSAGARTTWGGNHTYVAAALLRPSTLEEVSDLVQAHPRVRVLGSRHSFNDAADTTGVQISLDRIPVQISVDADARTAKVPGWATYAEVADAIASHDLALHTMASLPHISVAGAVATASHGSGLRNQGLAAAVRALELVDGRGEVVPLARGDVDFAGHVVHLGALGVVTSLTLDLVPAVPYHQRSYVGLSGRDLAAAPLEVLGAAASVSCFTRWQDDAVEQVLLKATGDPDADPTAIGGARPADRTLHPVPGFDATGVTEQLGVVGPWWDRLPHFRAEHQPSTGREIQSEWFVAQTVAGPAMEALWRVGSQLDAALQTSEIRTIAADDLWLSPAHGRDVVAFHFTWHLDPAAVERAVAVVEQALAPYDALPHWGKIWQRASGSHLRHPRLADFRALAARRDPEGRFANTLTDSWAERSSSPTPMLPPR